MLAAAATLSRRTLVAVVAAGCLGAFLLAEYLVHHRSRIVPQTILMSVGLCGYPIVVGLLLWQWLAAARSQSKSADTGPSSSS